MAGMCKPCKKTVDLPAPLLELPRQVPGCLVLPIRWPQLLGLVLFGGHTIGSVIVKFGPERALVSQLFYSLASAFLPFVNYTSILIDECRHW